MGAFFGTMVARLAISPLIPDIMDTYGVSRGAVGLVLTGLWGVYAVMQLPGGVLAGRYGERIVILVGIAFVAIGSILLFTAPVYSAFLVFALLIGIGSGLYFPAAASLLAKLYSNTGQALGFHLSGGDSGGMIAPIVAAYIAVRYGWRAAMLLGAAVAIPVLVLCTWRLRPTIPERPDQSLRERANPRLLYRLVSRPSIAYTILLAVVLSFAFQAVISFYPTFLIEHRSFTTRRASILFAAIFAIWIVLMPLMGRVSDTLGHDTVVAATILSMSLGLVLTITATSTGVVFLGIALIGVGMSWGGVLASRFMAELSSSDRTTGYGLVRSVYMLLGSLGSVVTGVVADSAGWPAAYGLVVVLLLIGVTSIGANRILRIGL